MKIGNKSLDVILGGMIILSIMLAVILQPVCVSAAENKGQYGTLSEGNFSDFANWKTGCYNWATGKYAIYTQRICATELKYIDSSIYRIEISDDSYKILIRELDENENFIKSVTLSDGDCYEPSENACYAAVSLYNYTSEASMNYEVYKKLFEEGFEINITGEANTEEWYIEDLDLQDFTNWKSGAYHWSTGKYIQNEQRLCLSEYVRYKGNSYIVEISDTSFQLLIRELDEEGNFITSFNLTNGVQYKPSENAYYLAIGIYRAAGESGWTLDSFEELFETGFQIKLTDHSSEADSEDEITDNPGEVETNTTENSTITEYTDFREELKDMLLSGDMTTHDVSRFNMTYTQMDTIFNELRENECYLAVETYRNMFVDCTRDSKGIVQTIYLYNADEGFPSRYHRVQEVVADAISYIDERMNDVEKLLVLHDYLVEHTYYRYSINAGYGGDTLAEGKGICQGYALALQILLHEAGIESYFLPSQPMDHGWVMVNLDGELYHVDPTWDDSRSRLEGEVDHIFLIRNDIEFRCKLPSIHRDWFSYTFDAVSTSTKYEDWFVHDVVGKMVYYEEYWYYSSGNTIQKAKIDGTMASTVVEESERVKILDLTSNEISYSINGNVKTIKL